MRSWVSRRTRRRPSTVVLADGHRDQVTARRAAATRLVDPAGPVAERITSAPPAYVLVHSTSDIVRHGELLTPLPAPTEVRVVATPGRHAGEWRLDIASRDRLGLLAAFSGVLSGHELDVVQAVLATWDDGGALQAFIVRAAEAPDCAVLERFLRASLDEELSSAPIADAQVTFDDAASALYTGCDVRAADRPGLLHAIAVAIAAAGADVHAARVTTAAGVAHDRFDLSDRNGGKLDDDRKWAIREAVLHGVDRVKLRRL